MLPKAAAIYTVSALELLPVKPNPGNPLKTQIPLGKCCASGGGQCKILSAHAERLSDCK